MDKYFINNLNKNIMKTANKIGIGAAAIILLVAVYVQAAPQSQFSQTINPGTLTTDIRDASRNSVANPSVAMSSVTVSFDCQTSSGTFGSNTERIYVDNPGAADNGWTLTIAASSTTATWQNASGTLAFDFNDGAGTPAGCSDGADTDSYAGQLTINPSVGTITTDCSSCNTNGITLGSSAGFVEGSVDSITLVTAAANSSDVGRWYFTGFSVSQTIPAEQDSDTYTIDLTLTVTAS